MKVKIPYLLTALTLLMTLGGELAAQPETAELREPEAIRVVNPVVPYEFSRYGITGEVTVAFKIDESGRPYKIEVVDATHREYADSVKEALRKWRYEAPELAGVTYRLPVLFK